MIQDARATIVCCFFVSLTLPVRSWKPSSFTPNVKQDHRRQIGVTCAYSLEKLSIKLKMSTTLLGTGANRSMLCVCAWVTIHDLNRKHCTQQGGRQSRGRERKLLMTTHTLPPNSWVVEADSPAREKKEKPLSIPNFW